MKNLEIGRFSVGVLAVGALVSVACGKSEAAAAPARERAQQVKDGDGAAAQQRVETESYVLEIKAPGPYAVGADSTFDVVLTAKTDFHINDQYPYKFTPKDNGNNVTYKGPVGRPDGPVDAHQITIKVPFSATAAGAITVGGRLSLSVCSDKNCLMDKQNLEVATTAK